MGVAWPGTGGRVAEKSTTVSVDAAGTTDGVSNPLPVLRRGADRSCGGGRSHEHSRKLTKEKKEISTTQERQEKREIRGGFAQALLILSLSLDGPKDFILPVINTWGLVVVTQFTK